MEGKAYETFAVYEDIGIESFIIMISCIACYRSMKDLKEIYPI